MTKSKKTNSNKHQAYLVVLHKLRGLIAESYSNGGWLPPGRKVCSMFEVNRKTYIKALKCLEKDGVAKAFPHKGHYIIPKFLRVKKIGIIMSDAVDSPFILADESICAILNVLREKTYAAQLIQAADLNNILDKALIHGVKGLIWLYPSAQILPLISKLNKTSEIPIIVMQYAKMSEKFKDDITSVTLCTDIINPIKVDFFAKRQHKKIAIVAKKESLEKNKQDMIPFFNKANIEVVSIPNNETTDLTIPNQGSSNYRLDD